MRRHPLDWSAIDISTPLYHSYEARFGHDVAAALTVLMLNQIREARRVVPVWWN